MSEIASALTLAAVHLELLRVLDASPHVSYIVDPAHRICYCNPAWDAFALANGAPHVVRARSMGVPLDDVIPDALWPLYAAAFEKVSSERTVWERCYDCSSPQSFRSFRMRIHPLEPGNCFLITNALLVERPHQKTWPPCTSYYVNAHGTVSMCAHCRCIRRIDHPIQWDFVPAYLKLGPQDTPRVSHGLCPVCHLYFFGPYAGSVS